jgi:hypothetical protein
VIDAGRLVIGADSVTVCLILLRLEVEAAADSDVKISKLNSRNITANRVWQSFVVRAVVSRLHLLAVLLYSCVVSLFTLNFSLSDHSQNFIVFGSL